MRQNPRGDSGYSGNPQALDAGSSSYLADPACGDTSLSVLQVGSPGNYYPCLGNSHKNILAVTTCSSKIYSITAMQTMFSGKCGGWGRGWQADPARQAAGRHHQLLGQPVRRDGRLPCPLVQRVTCCVEVLAVFRWLHKGTLARCARVCRRWCRLTQVSTVHCVGYPALVPDRTRRCGGGSTWA